MGYSFLVRPLKITKHATLKEDLYKFLKQFYSKEMFEIHKDAVAELDALRTECCELKDFKTTLAVSLLSTYLLQLLNLYPEISDSNCSLECTFFWSDSYEKSALSNETKKNTSSDFSFEIANVAHLLMSVIWNLTQDRSLTNEDDLKKSLQDFQALSGMFRYFSDYVNANSCCSRLTDLNPNLFSIYAELSFANAHEIMFHIAQKNKMSNSVFVVICKKLNIVYKRVVSLLKSVQSSHSSLKEILKYCESRVYFFAAIMNYYQTFVELQAINYSLYVSRAIAAKEFFKEGLKVMSPCSFILKMEGIINDQSEKAINDNRCIYSQQIIPASKLPEVPTTDIMQEKKFEPDILKLWITHRAYFDAFCKLQSKPVEKLVKMLNKCKDEIAKQKYCSIKGFNSLLVCSIFNQNVPACLEEHKPGDLPASLLYKRKTFMDYGGILKLRSEVYKIAEMRMKNIDMFYNLKRDLNIQESEDEKLNLNFPNEDPIIHIDINESALKGDELNQVKEYGRDPLPLNFREASQKLTILSKPPDELVLGTTGGIHFNPEEALKIERLKELVKTVKEIVAERDHIMTLFYIREPKNDVFKSMLKTKTMEQANLLVEEIALNDLSLPLQLYEDSKLKQIKFNDEFFKILYELNLKERVSNETFEFYKSVANQFYNFKMLIKEIREAEKFHLELQNLLMCPIKRKDFFQFTNMHRMMIIERATNNHSYF